MKGKVTITGLISILLLGCGSGGELSRAENDLLRFAEANCLMQYFAANQVDTSDIKKVTGGIVEKSILAADKFADTASLVAAYEPSMVSKQGASPLLNKCFQLREDEAFLDQLSAVAKR